MNTNSIRPSSLHRAFIWAAFCSRFRCTLALLGLSLASTPLRGETIFVEAESFADCGGWVIDQQSMDQMGSPYLMAHGLGTPVDDATIIIKVSQPGEYRVWVRTRDWAGPWKTSETEPAMRATGFPGKFQLKIDGRALKPTFGTQQSNWHWQDGGAVTLTKTETTLMLHDLTGFNGNQRCTLRLSSRIDPRSTGARRK